MNYQESRLKTSKKGVLFPHCDRFFFLPEATLYAKVMDWFKNKNHDLSNLR